MFSYRIQVYCASMVYSDEPTVVCAKLGSLDDFVSYTYCYASMQLNRLDQMAILNILLRWAASFAFVRFRSML